MKLSDWNYAIENGPRNDFFLILLRDGTWEKGRYDVEYDEIHDQPAWPGEWTINGQPCDIIAYQEIKITPYDEHMLKLYQEEFIGTT